MVKHNNIVIQNLSQIKDNKKILDNIFPIWWHIDTMMSFLIQKGKLNPYSIVPNIVFHPGKFSISSIDYTTDTPYVTYKSTLETDSA